MLTEFQSQQSPSNPESSAEVLLRIARNLHRAVSSGSLSVSLPIMRRLIATSTLTAVSLPELQRNRDIIQRKHVLRMLAVEAGFKCWEDYRHALDRMSLEELTHYEYLRRQVGYPNLWFPNYEEAQVYTKEQGGRALRVGLQAVVLTD